MIHLALHVLIPVCLAPIAKAGRRLRALGWMLLGMVIDLDHLLAAPVYDPQRCSIGFHPLHEPILAIAYLALAAYRKTRWFGVGLCLHLALDSLDCRLTSGVWFT